MFQVQNTHTHIVSITEKNMVALLLLGPLGCLIQRQAKDTFKLSLDSVNLGQYDNDEGLQSGINWSDVHYRPSYSDKYNVPIISCRDLSCKALPISF